MGARDEAIAELQATDYECWVAGLYHRPTGNVHEMLYAEAERRRAAKEAMINEARAAAEKAAEEEEKYLAASSTTPSRVSRSTFCRLAQPRVKPTEEGAPPDSDCTFRPALSDATAAIADRRNRGEDVLTRLTHPSTSPRKPRGKGPAVVGECTFAPAVPRRPQPTGAEKENVWDRLLTTPLGHHRRGPPVTKEACELRFHPSVSETCRAYRPKKGVVERLYPAPPPVDHQQPVAVSIPHEAHVAHPPPATDQDFDDGEDDFMTQISSPRRSQYHSEGGSPSKGYEESRPAAHGTSQRSLVIYVDDPADGGAAHSAGQGGGEEGSESKGLEESGNVIEVGEGAELQGETEHCAPRNVEVEYDTPRSVEVRYDTPRSVEVGYDAPLSVEVGYDARVEVGYEAPRGVEASPRSSVGCAMGGVMPLADPHEALIANVMRGDPRGTLNALQCVPHPPPYIFCVAALSGNLEVVRVLVQHVPWNGGEYGGFTPLRLAVLGGHTAVTRALARTAPVDQSLLHLASSLWRHGCVAALLCVSYTANTADSEGVTPLLEACRAHHCATREGEGVATVRTLIAGGADVHAVDCDGYSAVYHAAKRGWAKLAVEVLREGGWDSPEDPLGRGPLHWATIFHTPSMLVHLLSRDVNLVDREGKGCYHYSSGVCTRLLESRSNTNGIGGLRALPDEPYAVLHRIASPVLGLFPGPLYALAAGMQGIPCTSLFRVNPLPTLHTVMAFVLWGAVLAVTITATPVALLGVVLPPVLQCYRDPCSVRWGCSPLLASASSTLRYLWLVAFVSTGGWGGPSLHFTSMALACVAASAGGYYFSGAVRRGRVSGRYFAGRLQGPAIVFLVHGLSAMVLHGLVYYEHRAVAMLLALSYLALAVPYGAVLGGLPAWYLHTDTIQTVAVITSFTTDSTTALSFTLLFSLLGCAVLRCAAPAALFPHLSLALLAAVQLLRLPLHLFIWGSVGIVAVLALPAIRANHANGWRRGEHQHPPSATPRSSSRGASTSADTHDSLVPTRQSTPPC